MGRFAFSRRALFMVCALLVSGLIACGGGGGGGGGGSIGGGGGGGGGTPPTSSPTSTPPVGDAYSYTGTYSQTDTYTYPTPSPFPETTASATVSLSVIVTESPAPFATPAGGAYDIHDSESDVFPDETDVSTTDTWATTTSSATDEYGSAVTLGSGSEADTTTFAYSSPYVLDEFPETNGASWTNSPAGSSYESEPDGNDISRTIAASGTYSETQTLAGGYDLTITENSDGSGTYAGTILEAYGIQEFSYSAPSGGKITVEAVFPSPSPDSTSTPTPPIVLATPPAWYGSTPAFYDESDTVQTGVTFPGACNVAGTFGTSGNVVVRTIASLDTILGYTEAQTYDEYDTNTAGIVCVKMSDTQTYYYDYLDDTEQSYDDFAAFVGTPQQTVVTTETVGLQSETLATSSSRRSAQSTTPTHGFTGLQVAAIIAHFQARTQRVRQAREASLLQSIRTRSKALEEGLK